MRIRGRDRLTEREKDERLGGNVWMMREVTIRRGQDGLREREDDEKSGGSMWVMRQVMLRMRDQDGLTESEEVER
jgi:hypothetical protein